MNMGPIYGGITGAKDLLDAGVTLVTLLKQLKGQLLGQPEPATRALGTVLEEIDKTYRAVDTALGQYLGVLFNPNQQLHEQWNVEARRELVKLERDPLRAQLAEARTRSGKIGRIYGTYLEGWFERVFGPTEKREQLYRALSDLWGYDARIVDDLNGLASWLSDEAKTTLDLVDHNDFKSANMRILETRVKVSPFSREISKIMAELRDLQGEFDSATGVLGL